MRNKIIAIDFDGTLCENAFPEIGPEKRHIIDKALKEQKDGAQLILWTCRTGDKLAEAIRFCQDRGIIFDAINANVESWLELWDGDSRKVFADEYWDDKAVSC
jgi:hydroxymethylpyrimidine pyrophosphatase-like HAD family hydrolase